MKELESVESLLNACRMKEEVWVAADIELHLLKQIAQDHIEHRERLTDSAELFAKVIQRIQGVHSVRWRIKDPLHLIEKIVRKRAEKSRKYADIGVQNYAERVTDLVGVRALHLFKEDCLVIDKRLKETWTPVENPIAYVRQGDVSLFSDNDEFDVRNHPKGYRSIHYVFSNQPHQRKVFAEIQVRSIFEEGWSEIDHRVRYPNFSNSELVEYFLTIFNRMAGSADEMGSFVRKLVSNIDAVDTLVLAANQEKEAAIATMEATLEELEALKAQDADSRQKLTELQENLKNIRALYSKKKTELDYAYQRLLGIPDSDIERYIGKGGIAIDRFEQIKELFEAELAPPKTAAEMARRYGLGEHLLRKPKEN
ncbi:hypothetical protein FUT87_11700 [Mitsuaria sp. TWR114]|uniref:RelA/SpoT domain-containing protein n=1 Tax=Mitsuaria sp. TWR114 TaxID=2601731 RepID=UPI0011BDEC63|nr:RelA/SpoT domain-containing protein [Mitsuaria sp. TWR114]TXD88721.1 hypothetical protein FUT87_11700 [Mitsuaria sp. TWR114]